MNDTFCASPGAIVLEADYVISATTGFQVIKSCLIDLEQYNSGETKF